MTLSSLPLTSIGLACLFASLWTLGSRRLLMLLSVALLVAGLAVVVMLVLFLLDVPLALRVAQGPASLPIKKAIAKTTMLGIGFAAMYLAAGVAGVRQLRRPA